MELDLVKPFPLYNISVHIMLLFLNSYTKKMGKMYINISIRIGRYCVFGMFPSMLLFRSINALKYFKYISEVLIFLPWNICNTLKNLYLKNLALKKILKTANCGITVSF